jgi:hypothetical protein
MSLFFFEISKGVLKRWGFISSGSFGKAITIVLLKVYMILKVLHNGKSDVKEQKVQLG